MRNKAGFTIVELLVVIVVIGIISTASILTYTKVQQQSRDSQRAASATIISENLEKYFADNGEYPSVSQMTATNANTPKQLLGLNNLDSFIAPRSPAGTTTNLWKAGSATSTNKLTYTGNTDASASCLTGTAATDVCADYKIQYYVDKTSTVETLYSRNKSLSPPAAPAAPAATTVTAALSGSDVVATTTAATCSAGSSIQYAFRSRTNDGTWSSYTAWDVVLTTSLPAAEGVKYGFQAKSQCINNGLISADSAASNEGTYIHPISTPSAPILAVTPAAGKATATWNWGGISCPANTTAQYVTQFYRDDASTWRAYDFALTQTTTSVTYATNYEGYDHRARARARCVSTFATSPWSTDSNSPSYINPVTPPADPSNFRWSTYNGDQVFTWNESSCSLGAQQQRIWWGYHEATQYFANGTSTTTGGTTDIFNATRAGADTFEQWKSNAAFAASQLDMSIVNQTSYISTSAQAPGWAILVGSPNTDSMNDTAVRAVVQLRCMNTTTGRNATSSYIMSGMYTR